MNDDRLDTLLSGWANGSASEEEARELEIALRQDPAARRRFRRYANLDSALRDWAENRTAGSAWDAASLPAAPERRAKRGPVWLVAVAAMIALMAGAGWWAFRFGRHLGSPPEAVSPHESTAQGCAVLAQTLDAKFSGSARAAGETLSAGRLDLASGFAQIEFFSGATLLVEGEARVEILSAWEARCVSGKVRVRVPPAARGFRLQAPGVGLVDLGTEFAVNVDQAAQAADVHVFTGEVIALPEGRAELSLREGQGLHGAEQATLDPKQFLGIGQLQDMLAEREGERFQAWQAWSETVRQDSRLIAYFPFQHDPRWARLVENAAAPADRLKNGGAVGASWTRGRWALKDALQFRRPGDRVRLQIPGVYTALTLACWARVDSLDRRYNALLLTDGYDYGSPHWQIYEDGRLMFSVAYPKPDELNNKKAKLNQIYYSPAVLNAATMGGWHQLAVTYDNQSGEATQYFDGVRVSKEISAYHTPGRSLQFGPCELGNWGLPTEGHQFPIRNLNGALDEFAIYSARLSDDEIKGLYEHGKLE
jgi:anti-sigma factor RsiW